MVDNQGDEETTQIQKIALYGTPKDTFNVSDFYVDGVTQAPADASLAWYKLQLPLACFVWMSEEVCTQAALGHANDQGRARGDATVLLVLDSDISLGKAQAANW